MSLDEHVHASFDSYMRALPHDTSLWTTTHMCEQEDSTMPQNPAILGLCSRTNLAKRRKFEAWSIPSLTHVSACGLSY